MDKKIFRKVSIERLSSPEQLDKMITITSAKAWFILIAMGCILAAVVVWSITGSLATSVAAKGVLVKSGGIVDIISIESGQISDIRVRPGDHVKKGEIVARLNQWEIVDEIAELNDKLQLLKDNNADGKDIVALNNQIEELKDRLSSSSLIISQEEGRIIDVNVEEGDMVSPGTVVTRAVKEGAGVKNLIAVMYVPVGSGKKLAPGMETRISPSTVKKEEFGYILGRVVSVSEYPVTVHTAQQKLGSRELAEAYAGGTASLEVLVDLVTDSKTESGYRWSTLLGPPMKIENGTLCSASVIVKRQHPIEMVIPQIKNLLGE